MARMLVVLLALMPLSAAAADEQRISFLEQEVRNLQRQVQAHVAADRRIAYPAWKGPRPRRQRRRLSLRPRARTNGSTRRAGAQVRPGMNELEVIGLLGPPTSMREEGGARVLLYALEIGSSGFLGGSVTLRDRDSRRGAAAHAAVTLA